MGTISSSEWLIRQVCTKERSSCDFLMGKNEVKRQVRVTLPACPPKQQLQSIVLKPRPQCALSDTSGYCRSFEDSLLDESILDLEFWCALSVSAFLTIAPIALFSALLRNSRQPNISIDHNNNQPVVSSSTGGGLAPSKFCLTRI